MFYSHCKMLRTLDLNVFFFFFCKNNFTFLTGQNTPHKDFLNMYTCAKSCQRNGRY